MKVFISSHRGGREKIQKHLQDEIGNAVESTRLTIRKGVGSVLRDTVLRKLLAAGWSSEFPISSHSGMTITSTKNDVGLCFQTGNVARVYADLLKLQALYVDKVISAGIVVIPSHPSARVLGSNIAHADRLLRELEVFRKVIDLPLLVFAIE